MQHKGPEEGDILKQVPKQETWIWETVQPEKHHIMLPPLWQLYDFADDVQANVRVHKKLKPRRKQSRICQNRPSSALDQN